jgi:D-alanyl-D-alanine carboxypeptidase/D-alanyl-D-alanine-endopeptidase (penicillin-binding protein 4)
MRLRSILALGVVLAATACRAGEPLNAAALRAALDKALDSHATAARTTVTLKVVDLETGGVLYDRGGGKLLTPASNLKIYTSACALDAFGPDHRFETRVTAAGPIKDGTLDDNLILTGGGDAMLTHEDLAALAKKVVDELGVRRIKGQVLVDNSRYDGSLKGPGWMWDDDAEYYNMSVTPLMVDFNVATLHLTPDSFGATGALRPVADYPEVLHTEPDEAAPVAVKLWQFDDVIEVIDGQLDKPRDEKIAMHDPGPWVESLFKHLLQERGVEITDVEHDSSHAGKSLVHKGPTLAETMKHFHDKSENAVGEVWLHEIAVAKRAERADWPTGAKLITAWLVDKAGLEAGSFRLVDGSGLSRYNLISADSAVKLLTHMQKNEHFKVFFDSLPKEKVDGKECVYAKGGSMTGVSTISGYLRTGDGRLLAFSLLTNGIIGPSDPIKDLRQDVWKTLVRLDAEK